MVEGGPEERCCSRGDSSLGRDGIPDGLSVQAGDAFCDLMDVFGRDGGSASEIGRQRDLTEFPEMSSPSHLCVV